MSKKKAIRELDERVRAVTQNEYTTLVEGRAFMDMLISVIKEDLSQLSGAFNHDRVFMEGKLAGVEACRKRLKYRPLTSFVADYDTTDF